MTALRRMTIGTLGGVAATLGLALAAPAFGQDSDAPVDVTAAPPPSAETVGPSQLRDFNLQGTVTRPADQPESTGAQPATVAPAPVGSNEAVPSGATADPAPSAAESASRAPAPRLAVSDANGDSLTGLTGPDPVTPSLPLEVTTNPAPQPGLESEALPSASLGSTEGFFSWPWLAAIVALIGGVAFIAWSRGRRRRYGDPGRMAFAGLAPDVAPEAKPFPPVRPRPDPVPPSAAPRPAPTPPPAPAPKTADDGVIVSRSLKPELNVQFMPDRVVVTDTEVTLLFDVLVTNLGSAPARDVLVEGRMFTAHAGQDQEIGAFFQRPVGAGDRIAAIAPLGKLSLKSVVRLPLEQVHSFEVEGRRLFVPLVGFNLLFRSNGGDGQASASYLVGRGSEQDEKLAPFRIDLGPRVFRSLAARAHSMGLQPA